MKLEEAKTLFISMLQSLEKMPVDPWPFLCASALIEYLTKMVYGSDSGAKEYKTFISAYLAAANPQYDSFTYSSGEKDLPLQMYHVLRCGIVHSFSLIPDKMAASKGGRPRSVLIAHDGVHLSAYRQAGQDAALLVLHDFVDDLRKVIERIFLDASSDPALAARIQQHLKDHPPIMARFP